jgi:Mg2+-importing ATPase
MSPGTAIEHLQASQNGLTSQEAAARLKVTGPNILSTKKPPTWWQLLLLVLPNPFNILLGLLAIISVATPPPQWSTFILLIIMIVISCVVRFWQEYRSTVAAIKLQAGVSTDVRVRRQIQEHQTEDIVIDEKTLVPGDILLVDPGDALPADCMVIETSNLSISQSSMTGESEPQRKGNALQHKKTEGALFELENIVFMGTSVISGSGVALVLRTGDDAFLATIMKQLIKKRPLNAFQRGVRNVSYMMIAFMLVMVPIVLVTSGKITGNWGEAALFSVSVAVGLVPEMLPAIVNANLARGAFTLAKKKAIVKRLDSIQNMGSMSVLCSDKTGTLTKDEIALCHHVDPAGNEEYMIFKLAYANAINQSGKKNSIDTAILKHIGVKEIDVNLGQKVGEIPFNFESRRSSCIIRTPSRNLTLICKGAFDEVSSLCTHIRFGKDAVKLDPQSRQELSKRAAAFNDDGYRVILVATREVLAYELEEGDNLTDLDTNMVVEGLLTFLDPPKDDAKASIARLQELGVDVKVLTGDNLGVAMKVCRSLELVNEVDEEHVQAINGPDLAKLEGTDEFHTVVKHCKIFAKLNPSQKGQVIMSLKSQNEVVGMLGDGINDCVALRFADAGISVDTGANVAKDCADIILTEKKLSIIVDCVVTGRITHGNTIKYIKMVSSSNFGNVFSILAASAWLPFDPMSSLQILIQNLLYDISQIAIPWDRMDADYLATPKRWDVKDLLRFVIILGPTSSTIDMCTFLLNWFYYDIRTVDNTIGVKVFHTHWFLEGLLTQTLIVHLLRTAKIPVIQSRAAKVLVASTMSIMAVGLAIPYIPSVRDALGMMTPKSSFMGFLAVELVVYCLEVHVVKLVYVRVWGRWL